MAKVEHIPKFAVSGKAMMLPYCWKSGVRGVASTMPEGELQPACFKHEGLREKRPFGTYGSVDARDAIFALSRS